MEVVYLLTAEIPTEFHCAQTQLSICKTLPTIATLNSKRIKPNIKITDFKLTLLVFS